MYGIGKLNIKVYNAMEAVHYWQLPWARKSKRVLDDDDDDLSNAYYLDEYRLCQQWEVLCGILDVPRRFLLRHFPVQAAGVYLPRHMETQTFEMQSHAMSIRFSRGHESAFGDIFASGTTSVRAANEDRPSATTQYLTDQTQRQIWPSGGGNTQLPMVRSITSADCGIDKKPFYRPRNIPPTILFFYSIPRVYIANHQYAFWAPPTSLQIESWDRPVIMYLSSIFD